MKKKIVSVTVVAVVALVAGFAISQEKKEVALSNLMLSNIEALANIKPPKNNKSLAQKTNGDYCCVTNEGNNCTQSPDC